MLRRSFVRAWVSTEQPHSILLAIGEVRGHCEGARVPERVPPKREEAQHLEGDFEYADALQAIPGQVEPSVASQRV